MSEIITKRIYYTEPHLYSCTARVLSCEPVDGGFEVVLSETVLFPEGGGQPSDSGTVAGKDVLAAYDRGERIVYLLKSPLKVGDEVEVTVDAERRLDHSRQHSGEHMLSGLLKRDFNAANVGFHMSAEYSTIDIDRELDADELSELELSVNRAIAADLPITIEIVAPNDLKDVKLRKDTSKLEAGDEPVRIVYIGESGSVDACACCGTHVARTGEVGYLSITSVKRHRGGMRIWFLCGERAVRDSQNKRHALDAIAGMFSTGYDEALDSVRRCMDENGALKHALRVAQGELHAIRARDLVSAAPEASGVKVIVAESAGNAADAKQLTDKVISVCTEGKHRCIVVTAAHDSERIYYTVGCTEGIAPDAGEICKVVNALFNGRGGGRGTLAQGSSAFISESQLNQSLEALEQYLKSLSPT